MTLLNYIFRGENSKSELNLDNNRRLEIWNNHLALYKQKEELARNIDFPKLGSPDSPGEAITNWENTIEVLTQIEGLISQDLVVIEDEEKSEEKVLNDIKEAKDYRDLETKINEQRVKETLEKIYKLLKAELRTIRLIKTKPKNVHELLRYLFQSIYNTEGFLYKLFNDEGKKIEPIIQAILFEEEVKIEKDEKLELAQKILTQIEIQLDDDDNIEDNSYLDICQYIYSMLVEKANIEVQLRGDKNLIANVNKMEEIMGNDYKMREITTKAVKNLHFKELEIDALIIAFREGYNKGFFDDWAEDL